MLLIWSPVNTSFTPKWNSGSFKYCTFGPSQLFWGEEFLPIFLWNSINSIHIFKQFWLLIWVWTVWKNNMKFSTAGYQVEKNRLSDASNEHHTIGFGWDMRKQMEKHICSLPLNLKVAYDSFDCIYILKRLGRQ